MKPPGPDWRAWGYFAAFLCAGPVMLGFVIWLLKPVRDACPAGHQRFCLEIADRAILGGLALAGLVVVGLVVRTTIRNLKGSAGAAGVSLEAESHRDEERGR